MGDCGRRPRRAPLDREAYEDDPFQLEMFADEMSLLDDDDYGDPDDEIDEEEDESENFFSEVRRRGIEALCDDINEDWNTDVY